jgi:pyrroline-5-carboxylate reductase
MSKKIAIIGGGNLGSAIAEGLIKSKFCKPSIKYPFSNVNKYFYYYF